MRQLLDAPTQRLIKILEVLAVREGGATIAALASAVAASERTVAEDIAKLKKQWGHILMIETSKKNGVRLRNQNTASIGLVFADLFKDSVALRWIKELLFNPNRGLDYYESRLFVSRSTLIRLLPQINRFLASRGMEIKGVNNQYQFLGKDEQYLRDFSACFLLEVYGLNLQQSDITFDLGFIRDLLLPVLSRNLEPGEFSWILNDDASLTYQVMFYLVSLMREEQGYAIISDYLAEDEVDAQSFDYLQAHFPSLQKANLRPIHQYIFDQYNGWDSVAEKILVADETEAFLQQVFSAVSFSPDEDLRGIMSFTLKSLYLNTKLRSLKTSLLFDRVQYFAFSLKRTNPLLHQVTEAKLQLFSQNVKLEMNSRIADVLFWLCLVCPQLYQVGQPKAALVISDFGRLHAEFLARILSDSFNKKNAEFLKIDIATDPNALAVAELGKYAALITTVPNLPVAHRHILLINDCPSPDELHEIYKALL